MVKISVREEVKTSIER